MTNEVLSYLRERFDRVDKTLVHMDRRFDELERRVGVLDRKVGRLAPDAEDEAAEAVKGELGLAKLEKRVDALEERLQAP